MIDTAARAGHAGIMPYRMSQMILLVLFGCFGCSTMPKVNSKAQIESLLAQRQALKTTFLEPAKSKRRPDYDKYVAQVKGLDASRCPPEFQQAWFDYVIALEQAHALDRDADWEGVGKFLRAVAAVHTGGAALMALPGLASPTTKSRLKKDRLMHLEDARFRVEG